MRSRVGRVLGVVALAGMGFAAVLFALSPARITLIADGEVPIYDRAEVDATQRVLLGTLKAGTRIHVAGCVDLKHYIVPQVLMTDGRKGYVIEGLFHLERGAALSAAGAPVSWRC